MPKSLVRLPDALRDSQDVFERTGGLHAAALFDPHGKLLVLREDIGRHNAVDKVIGWALLEDRVPLSDSVLLVSGRGGFEIVQKAIVAGVPVVASVSAPSSLAVQLARELRLTLIGFLRGRRFVIYAGEERVAGNTAKSDEAQPLTISHAARSNSQPYETHPAPIPCGASRIISRNASNKSRSHQPRSASSSIKSSATSGVNATL